MHILLLSLIPPFLFALSNHLDKYIVSRNFKSGGGIGTLTIYSSLFGILAMGAIFAFNHAVFAISGIEIIAIATSGILSILGILLYLYALNTSNVSSVVPLFQLVPLFSLVLGFFLLKETLSFVQINGGLIIACGSILISFEKTEKIKFKHKAFWLMFCSSLLMSLSAITFKIIAIRTDYWTTAFWSYAGTFIVGLIFFICIKKWRAEFLHSIKGNAKLNFLNITNEIVNAGGALIMAYATLLAPVALIQFVGGIQPLFILAIGVLIAVFIPAHKTEHLSGREIAYKLIAIFIMLLGLALIY